VAKKVIAVVKIFVPGAQATPQPPVGQALGFHGVNAGEFCKVFNARTSDKAGMLLPTVVTIYQDRSFTFEIKTPPASWLLKKAAGLVKASPEPSRQIIGQVKRAQVQEIAEMKMPDLNAHDVEAAMRIVEGTARSMGIQVVEG